MKILAALAIVTSLYSATITQHISENDKHIFVCQAYQSAQELENCKKLVIDTLGSGYVSQKSLISTKYYSIFKQYSKEFSVFRCTIKYDEQMNRSFIIRVSQKQFEEDLLSFLYVKELEDQRANSDRNLNTIVTKHSFDYNKLPIENTKIEYKPKQYLNNRAVVITDIENPNNNEKQKLLKLKTAAEDLANLIKLELSREDGLISIRINKENQKNIENIYYNNFCRNSIFGSTFETKEDFIQYPASVVETYKYKSCDSKIVVWVALFAYKTYNEKYLDIRDPKMKGDYKYEMQGQTKRALKFMAPVIYNSKMHTITYVPFTDNMMGKYDRGFQKIENDGFDYKLGLELVIFYLDNRNSEQNLVEEYKNTYTLKNGNNFY